MLPYCDEVSKSSLLLLRHYSTSRDQHVRAALYPMLVASFEVFGPAAYQSLAVPALRYILEDIERPAASSDADITFAAPAANSKKRRKAMAEGAAAKEEETAEYAAEACTAQDVAVSRQALMTLSSLLSSCGSLLPSATRQAVDNTLMRHIECTTAPRAPSVMAALRGEAYSALVASLCAPHRTQSPLLPHALAIFKTGSADPCSVVAAICVQGRSICEIYIHPRAPALFLPEPSQRDGEVAGSAEANTVHTSLFAAAPVAPLPSASQFSSALPAPNQSLMVPVADTQGAQHDTADKTDSVVPAEDVDMSGAAVPESLAVPVSQTEAENAELAVSTKITVENADQGHAQTDSDKVVNTVSCQDGESANDSDDSAGLVDAEPSDDDDS